MKIGIIDYGAGNIGKILKVMKYFDANYKLISSPTNFKYLDKIIFPGQGAFSSAMNNLESSGLRDEIKEFNNREKPILGICLGMQLLFSRSEEFNNHDGLGLLSGTVSKIALETHPIPIIGWYNITSRDDSKDHSIFKNINKNQFYYFAHSMECKNNGSGTHSYVHYGSKKLIATVYKNNIYGTQFHPELSDKNGLKIIENFLGL